MKRSTRCKTCGRRIQPYAKDMSLGAATRKHYWRYHPERMLAGQAARMWAEGDRSKRPGKRPRLRSVSRR